MKLAHSDILMVTRYSIDITRAATQGKKDKQQPLLSVDAEKNEWMLRPDLMSVIDCAVTYSIPAFKDEGKPLEGLAVRNAQVRSLFRFDLPPG